MTDEEQARYIAHRSEEGRKHTGIRLSERERKELDDFAKRIGLVTRNGRAVRSAALRLRNKWAAEHMPDNWRPKAEVDAE